MIRDHEPFEPAADDDKSPGREATAWEHRFAFGRQFVNVTFVRSARTDRSKSSSTASTIRRDG
jgi:hypothetical protein